MLNRACAKLVDGRWGPSHRAGEMIRLDPAAQEFGPSELEAALPVLKAP